MEAALKSQGILSSIAWNQNTCVCSVLHGNLGSGVPRLSLQSRGFAIKLNTGEGNYDVVWLNFVSLQTGGF
ncbi:hypothetical protein BJX64DRAFT_140084 [Aspergillus heterothallicus]